MVLGMLQWLLTLSKPKLSPAMASLNRFGTCPRQRHLELAIRVFSYVKTVIHKQITIDLRPLLQSRTTPDYEKLCPDSIKDYPGAIEDIDKSFPKPFGPILEQTLLVDSNHAHDLVTYKSLTGYLGYVRSTPVP